MRPILEESASAAAIGLDVEMRALVGPQAREERQVVRSHQHVDGIDLQQPEPLHDPTQASVTDLFVIARSQAPAITVEVTRPACVAQTRAEGEPSSGHPAAPGPIPPKAGSTKCD